MRTQTIFTSSIFVLLLSFLSSPALAEDAKAWERPNEKQWKAFNLAAVREHIIPSYQHLKTAAELLNKSTVSFCKETSEQRFAEVKTHFHNTMDAWQSIQHMTFGPIEYNRRAFSLQFWPDKKNHVGKHLAKLIDSNNQSSLSDENFKKASVSVRGLPAIERLLFDKDALSKLQDNSFRCDVLNKISQNVEVIATSLYTEWKESMLPQFEDSQQVDGYFEDDIDAATALLKTIVEPLEVIKDLKLLRPIGSEFGLQKYKRLESWRSERSLRNIVLNLASTEAMLSAGPSTHQSLLYLIKERARQDIENKLSAINLLVDQLEGSLEQSINEKTDYKAIKKLSQAIGVLHNTLEKEISALDIHLGFNSRDGD